MQEKLENILIILFTLESGIDVPSKINVCIISLLKFLYYICYSFSGWLLASGSYFDFLFQKNSLETDQILQLNWLELIVIMIAGTKLRNLFAILN